MSTPAPLGLQPLIEQVIAGESDAPQHLTHALTEILRSLLLDSTADRHSDGLRELIASLRAGADRVSPSARGAMPVLLAAADAVRHAIVRDRPATAPAATARLPQTALEFAALGATEQLAHVDRTIADLEQTDPTAAPVARLRFYAGLDLQDIALVLDMSSSNVRRAWNRVRARLRQ